MLIYINARFLTQPITGVQRYGIEMSKALKKILKEDIKFVTPHNVIDKKLSEELDAIVIGKRTGHIWEQVELPNYLKQQGSPLLINWANTAPIFYKNKITTIHDVAFNVFPDAYNKKFLYYYKFIIPKIINSSKHIITVSEFSKKEIIKYYNIKKEKISVIHASPIDCFSFEKDELLEKENYFLIVSSLNKRKNMLAALDAFNSISEDNDKLSLFIIGDMESHSFSEINLGYYLKNKKIKMLGRISDEELNKYYSNAIAFIFPSIYEGFGLPPLEAQRSKCPVIVSNAASLPEIYLDSALYCDPYNTNDIGDKMKLMAENKQLRTELSQKGYNNSLNFTWGKNALSFKYLLSHLKF